MQRGDTVAATARNTATLDDLVDKYGEQHIPVSGRVGYPFFGQLILDCLEGTERAMTQEHAFRAAELCLQAQEHAVHIEG